MMFINGKFLEARQLPAAEPYPPSTLIALLVGTETINLVGGEELFSQIKQLNQFAQVLVEVRWRKLDLASFGGSGKGNVYRLKAMRLVNPKELVS